MDSAPPPEPAPVPASDPQPPLPYDKGWSWRKTLWIVLAVVVVVPLAWMPCAIVAAIVHNALRFGVATEGPFILLLSIPFALAMAFVVARRGLWRGWHHRRTLLGGWSIAATGVIALSVLALQAFNRVRQSSQDKVVLCNVGMLAAAADQYYLENGVTSVAFPQLVGPTNYVKAINLVDRETYPARFTQGVTITVMGIAGARTITYAP